MPFVPVRFEMRTTRLPVVAAEEVSADSAQKSANNDVVAVVAVAVAVRSCGCDWDSGLDDCNDCDD